MARTDKTPPLKGDALVVLLTLADGPLHGYAILREAEDRSDGEVRLQTGALYRTLKRLMDGRLIEECERPASARGEDERRRYYRLTQRGRQELAAEAERLEKLLRRIRLASDGRRVRA